MAAIAYYIALPFIYLIALLPFSVMYLLSDFFYVIIYKVLGYRKQVVMTNLRNAFPNKTEQELNKLAAKYYSFLCDVSLETFKVLTMSADDMIKRCSFTDEALELLNSFAKRDKSIILTMGHLGNWEWSGSSFSIQGKQQLNVIYHPLTNKHFDNFLYNMRSRFGTGLIAMDNVFKAMVRNRNKTTITGFIADQTPPPDNAYWMDFLNQDTPVFKGTELIAKKLNYPVVYAAVKRVKRGYYKIFIEQLVETPKDTTDGEITRLHTKRLEKDIIELPETWIWSHRRWKHKRDKETLQN